MWWRIFFRFVKYKGYNLYQNIRDTKCKLLCQVFWSYSFWQQQPTPLHYFPVSRFLFVSFSSLLLACFDMTSLCSIFVWDNSVRHKVDSALMLLRNNTIRHGQGLIHGITAVMLLCFVLVRCDSSVGAEAGDSSPPSVGLFICKMERRVLLSPVN